MTRHRGKCPGTAVRNCKMQTPRPGDPPTLSRPRPDNGHQSVQSARPTRRPTRSAEETRRRASCRVRGRDHVGATQRRSRREEWQRGHTSPQTRPLRASRTPHPAASRAPDAHPAEGPSTGTQHTGPSCLAGPQTRCPGRGRLRGRTGLFHLPGLTFQVPTAYAEMTDGDNDTPGRGHVPPPTHRRVAFPSLSTRWARSSQNTRETLGHSPEDTAHRGAAFKRGHGAPRGCGVCRGQAVPSTHGHVGGPTSRARGPAGALDRGGRSEGHRVSAAPATMAGDRDGVSPISVIPRGPTWHVTRPLGNSVTGGAGD